MDSKKLKSLDLTAIQVRKDILEMIYSVGTGNIGPALSVVEIIVALYFEIMKIRPEDPQWAERDKFILSKGHAAPALYSALARRGFFSPDILTTFRRFNSKLQTHPEYGKLQGIEFGSGSLGQGLSAAIGMALACRYLKRNRRVFVLVGDGESQEGQIWEAAMACSHYKLSEVTVIIDNNKLQSDTAVEKTMKVEPIIDKWLAFGWDVKPVDGHSISDIIQKTKELESSKKPKALIASTTKGKGISFMENNMRWHIGQGMTRQDYDAALDELNQRERVLNG